MATKGLLSVRIVKWWSPSRKKDAFWAAHATARASSSAAPFQFASCPASDLEPHWVVCQMPSGPSWRRRKPSPALEASVRSCVGLLGSKGTRHVVDARVFLALENASSWSGVQTHAAVLELSALRGSVIAVMELVKYL